VIDRGVRREERLLAEIEAVYRREFAAFVRVATAVVGDEQLARDAVHDGFVGAVRARRGFRGEGTLEAWLWRAVVNAARRRRAVRLRSCTEELDLELAADQATPAALESVRAAIALLPERQRLVLFLRYFADLDYAAIAAVAGIAPGTVAATLHAARAALRRALEEVERCESST
jgi:RNA polymerase sigma factor (sigma-70 family)